MNDLEGGRSIFTNLKDSLASAANFAYFVRNAAGAFEAPHAIELQEEACMLFKQGRDLFGYATTLSNKAMERLYTNELGQALAEANEAYAILETFGLHHLHVVMNNLGILKMLGRNYAEAEKDLLESSLSREHVYRRYLSVSISPYCIRLRSAGRKQRASSRTSSRRSTAIQWIGSGRGITSMQR